MTDDTAEPRIFQLPEGATFVHTEPGKAIIDLAAVPEGWLLLPAGARKVEFEAQPEPAATATEAEDAKEFISLSSAWRTPTPIAFPDVRATRGGLDFGALPAKLHTPVVDTLGELADLDEGELRTWLRAARDLLVLLDMPQDRLNQVVADEIYRRAGE